jgi:hypothetical protein
MQLSGARLGRISAVVILLALSLTTLEVGLASLRGGPLETVLGLKTSEAYLAETMGWFEPAMKAVRELPEGSLAQLIYEPRSLYCAPRCLPDELLDRWKTTLLSEGEDAQAVTRSFRAGGITHLLVHHTGMHFLVEAGDPHHPASDIAALEKYLKTLPAPVDFGGVYQLYSLEPLR